MVCNVPVYPRPHAGMPRKTTKMNLTSLFFDYSKLADMYGSCTIVSDLAVRDFPYMTGRVDRVVYYQFPKVDLLDRWFMVRRISKILGLPRSRA